MESSDKSKKLIAAGTAALACLSAVYMMSKCGKSASYKGVDTSALVQNKKTRKLIVGGNWKSNPVDTDKVKELAD